MRKPSVWLFIAAAGFIILVILGAFCIYESIPEPVKPMPPGVTIDPEQVQRIPTPPPARGPVILAYFAFVFGSAGMIVGLIGAIICARLKPKQLDLPYASVARGFEVRRSE